LTGVVIELWNIDRYHPEKVYLFALSYTTE